MIQKLKNFKSIIFILIFTFISINIHKFNKKRDDFYKIQKYILMNLNEKLINSSYDFPKVTNPKISVIISVYNGKGYLKTAVRSIQNQDFKDIEIIIIDDFSTDESIKIIRELMKEDPRIVFLANTENKGLYIQKQKESYKQRENML